jgi:hypothetical protein
VKQIKELKRKGHLMGQILDALSTDELVWEILRRLKNGETYDSIVEWLGRASMDNVDISSTFVASDHEMGGVSTTFRWTAVTADSAILDHLFQLYFCWVHPVHTLFSEGHFLDSYKRQSHQYCSSLLVNSLCAMACHLHTSADADEVDFGQLGHNFTDAVRCVIDSEDTNITTIQAFAVMFLVDCACGSALRATSYLEVATRNLSNVLSIENDGFKEVLKNTSRGIQSLNV